MFPRLSIVALTNLMSGAVFGWLAPTLQTYRNSKSDFSLTDEDCSWMVALQYAGRICGCLLTAATIDQFGRVAIISLGAIWMTISWWTTTFTKVVILHYVLRFIFGICLGMISITTPIYTGENSSPQMRGVFGSSCLMLSFGGQVIGCALATYCSYTLAAGIIAGVSLISLVSTMLLREPSQYLLVRGHEAKAERQFFWLRGNDENAQQEFNEIRVKLKNRKTKFSLAQLLDRRILIVCTVNSLVFLTGYPVMVSLVSIALSPAGNFSANELTILFEVVQLSGAILSLFIIDRYNRRTLWTVSCTLSIVFHLMTAMLYYLHEKYADFTGYSWLLFGSITAYTTVFSTVMYSLSSTTRGEFLPQKYKGAGSCVSLIANSIIGGIQGYTFLKIASNFGMKMNFIFFAVSSFALLAFCYYLVPETRGMTLMEIEKHFEELKEAKGGKNTAEK